MKKAKSKIPPCLAQWILGRILADDHQTPLGDFEEFYSQLSQTKGVFRSRMWYRGQVIRLLFPKLLSVISWRFSMFRNTLKIALRNLQKHKSYTFLNITGLAVGIACCLLILLYIQHELSFDRYHENRDRIVRMVGHANFGSKEFHNAGLAAPTAATMVSEFPEVEKAVRIYKHDSYFIGNGFQTFKEESIAFADADLFEMFTIPFLHGESKLALVDPNSITISRDMAVKYFGSTDAVGKILSLNSETDYRVTGVFENMPSNSHFRFEFFASLISLDDSREPWWFNNMKFITYLLMSPGSNPAILEGKFPALAEKYVGPDYYNENLNAQSETGMVFYWELQPVTRIHLYSDLRRELAPTSDIKTVTLFGCIAFFILLIACVNFMNLSTARSFLRAREVGIRKVLGSDRSQLVRQFLSESIILAICGLVVALLIVAFFLPAFNNLSGKELKMDLIQNSFLMISVFGLILFTGLLAGSYPAFFLSSFKPAATLKKETTGGAVNRRIRSGLVVFQFTLSIILMISTGVIGRQMKYVRNKKLGFDREQVLVIHDTAVLNARMQAFKTELARHPEIIHVTVAGNLPVTSRRVTDVMHPEGIYRENGTAMQKWQVDSDYIHTLGMEIIQGRNFSDEFATDSNTYLVNEAAVKHFGWEEPIGKKIGDFEITPVERLVDFNVIGVVKNFHFESLRDNIGPLVLHLGSSPEMIALRLNSNQLPETLKKIRMTWQQFAPNYPFAYSFMDDRFDAMYRVEQRTGRLFTIFSILAISIGCLGLFGLAAFTAERRTKEVGIRKVMGATVPRVVLLLTGDFIRLVVVANIIAWPAAWLLMKQWLKGFAYPTPLSIWIFLIAGLAALTVAVITVSVQAIRAALSNPVDSLRYE